MSLSFLLEYVKNGWLRKKPHEDFHELLDLRDRVDKREHRLGTGQ